MRFVRDIHKSKNGSGPVISFEFFPPKTEEGERKLFDRTIPLLRPLRPDFCSVTYGAAGSTRDKTLAIADRIQKESGLPAVSHLTCVSATKEQLRDVLLDARSRGIQNILALRGDPPSGISNFQRTEGGFEFSSQLVDFVREFGGFCVGAAGFPEGHIACQEGKHVDWQRLRHKVEAGAEFIVTQLFFRNEDFFEFRDYVRKLGITVPLIAGLLPILSASQIKRFSTLCGAKLPPDLVSKLEELSPDPASVVAYGIEVATRQCQELIRGGVDGLHFYTLNEAHSTTEVLRNLRPTGEGRS